MDIERLKEKRKGLRISFTKHLNKIEGIFSAEITEEYTKPTKIDELLSLRAQLAEKLNELIKIDEEVQCKIEIKEIAGDVSECEEYKRGIDRKGY